MCKRRQTYAHSSDIHAMPIYGLRTHHDYEMLHRQMRPSFPPVTRRESAVVGPSWSHSLSLSLSGQASRCTMRVSGKDNACTVSLWYRNDVKGVSCASKRRTLRTRRGVNGACSFANVKYVRAIPASYGDALSIRADRYRGMPHAFCCGCGDFDRKQIVSD